MNWMLWLSGWVGGFGLGLVVSAWRCRDAVRKVVARAESLDILVMRQHQRNCRMMDELEGHRLRIRELSAALARVGYPEVDRNGRTTEELSDPGKAAQ